MCNIRQKLTSLDLKSIPKAFFYIHSSKIKIESGKFLTSTILHAKCGVFSKCAKQQFYREVRKEIVLKFVIILMY